jgi:hypothetical protein
MTYDWRILGAVVLVAAIAGWLVVQLPGGRDLDPGEIDRDLAELSEVLRRDRAIEAEVLPPPVRRPSLPSTTLYRRAPLFWRSALMATAKGPL